MLIYHASDMVVSKPDILHSRRNLDFGRGFYVTELKEQAERYAQRFVLRKRIGVINIYEYNLVDGFNVLSFDSYDGAWLDFVAACRMGDDRYLNYDIVCGGVANDRIFNTLDLYFSNQMAKEEALKRIIFEKPNQQYCFISQKAIDECIRFVDCIELKK